PQTPWNLGWMLLAARLHGGVTIRSLRRGAAMPDDPALRPRMTSVVYKTLRSSELALTQASWDLDGTAPDGTRTRLSGIGTIVSRRGPDGAWRIVLDDPQSGAAAAGACVISGWAWSAGANKPGTGDHRVQDPYPDPDQA